METRLEQQLNFIREIDKMTHVERRTLLVDGSRRENDAEHSWHIAVMAMLFTEYSADPAVDMQRVVRMCLVHDLIEIYAGDTFAYDAVANGNKKEREARAADRLYALLPPEQGAALRALWEEFDAEQTPDARYAAAMDHFQPFYHNYLTNGHTWIEGRVTREQVLARMEIVRTATPGLWPFVETVLKDGVEKGYIR